MGTVSLLIFYILLLGAAAFSWYCSKLSLKKALAHLIDSQRFSAFTFYGLYLIASMIAVVVVAATLSEFVVLVTGLYLAPMTFAAVLGVLVILTLIGAVAIAHKSILKARQDVK